MRVNKILSSLGIILLFATAAIVWHCTSPFWWTVGHGHVNGADVVDMATARYVPPRYHLNLQYTFQADHKTYAGQGFIGYDDSNAAKVDAQQFLSGSPVSVFYDPRNPDASMLVGNRNQNLQQMLVFLSAAAVVVIWSCTRVACAQEEPPTLQSLK